MRKIHLDLETLQVASFATTAARTPARGTVHGQDEGGMELMDASATAASACSWTNGAFACKSCGPCCGTL
jgi:hypothetical protein